MTRRPNFLVIMVDQFNGTLFPDGPADFLHAPNLKALAARSLRFANCYTASPLCAPARASFMSGLLPKRTRVYDNAAEFASDIPTFAHHLRRAGYHTVLSGKMHFVGPDQLHGFEERLTTDIYPADFGWTPDYRKPGERIDWWYHNLGSVTGAGVAEITNQMEYDDEVAFLAGQKLYDLSRGADARPWCLTVSFTHPHDPYVARRKYWDLYEGCPQLDPPGEPIAYDDQDPHSRRLMDACDWRAFDISAENIRRARRGYFANISYLDDKVGEILAILEATRQEAVILFVSDHGDMLGERGLWFKMNFFEGSARVPLMIAAPGIAPRREDRRVSTLDVAPTLCEVAGIAGEDYESWIDGASLVPIFDPRGLRLDPVRIEYAAEGSIAPMVCLVDGPWKYIRCAADPEQLYHLDSDPAERRNLAGSADLAAVPDGEENLAALRALADEYWNLDTYDAAVRESQARRWVVYEALRNGAYFPWDFQPLQRASERYMRNHMDLNILEESKRYPRGGMMITVYGRATSSNVQTVMWAIAELGLAHERLDIGGTYGGNDTPDYRAMNPNGLVPTIRDGELVMWESAAITRYLGARYGSEAFWPSDPVERARLDMWAEWTKTTFYPVLISQIFVSLVRTPAKVRDMAALGRAADTMKGLARMLDARLAKGPYLGGEELSFADIIAGHLLYRYHTLDFERADTPALAAYYDHLTARPAYREHVMVSYAPLRHPEA